MLLQWGIDHIFTITVDNASSNDMTIDYLRRKTKDTVGSLLVCEFLHMLKGLNESIVKVRNVVRYVKFSLYKFEKFNACVKKEKKFEVEVCCVLTCLLGGIEHT